MSQRKSKSRTSFGPTAPPFLDYLKNILRRYPDGGQILKELIQNADDGQATEVVFIHDERRYGTESLWTNKLGKYQGPALYAYNNAAFTDEDWERIQMAGRSGKVNDPNKIGRFGIGFNSIYHITDVPIIFSSGYLGVMDPQENIFGERNGGFLWSLDDEEHKEALMTMHDQFQPFRDIVSILQGKKWSQIMEDQHFAGTLFRFPLRNETSEISDNLYNSGKVVELFDSFIADAELSLLFLKSVRSVSLVHISCDGTVKTRLEVKASSSEAPLKSEDDSDLEGLTRFKHITLKSEDYKDTRWLVTTCTMKKGIVEELDVLAEKLSFVPRVDLAFPSSEQRFDEGRLSCFLPLPNNESNKTGLPVHVNACFGLTDNRRHIKWQEEDQKHDKHALWNELMVNKVLPKAFVVMIQDATKLCQESRMPVSSVYRLWPDISHMKHKDKWLAVAQDVFDQLFRQNAAVFSLAKDERWFVPLSDAIIPSNGPESPDIVNAVKRTLVFYGENLVTVPANVMTAIMTSSHSTPKQVTPGFVRGVLLRNGVQYIAKEDKLCLLEFVLSDENYNELQGLQLLPLSDGSFISFTNREEDTALIDSKEFPRTLLPCCKHLFTSNDLSSTCRTYLKKLASKNFFRVIVLDAACVVKYTRRYLPQDWTQTEKVVLWKIGSSQHPPSDWIHQFWKFLNHHFKDLNDFTEIPLIPVSPLSNSCHVLLAKLQEKTTLIFQKTKKSYLQDQMAQLVTKAGGTVVKGNDWLRHEDLDSYVLSPSPRSVLTILSNVNRQHLTRCLTSGPFAVLEGLKSYLSDLDFLSNTDRDLLMSLPLFQSLKGISVNAKSKQAVLLTATPRVPTDLPMPDSYIRCTSKADDRILQLLKVNTLGPAEAAVVLVEFIERMSCSAAETEKIMTWILQHGRILFSQSEVLKYKCRDLRFIQRNGEQTRVSSFFDPRVKTFVDIFEVDFFPPPMYTRTEQMLESLTDLGLKSKEADVKPEHLLQAAKLVEKLHANSPNKAFRRAQVLLGLMDSKDLLSVFSAEQLCQLKMIRWLQCDQPGQEKRQLMDESEKTLMYSPDEVRHTMFEDIVGLVMPLTNKLSERVSSKLGLKQLPPPEKVTENLLVLKSKAKEMTNPDTNADFKQKLHSIYRHMQENCSAFAAVMDKKECWLWAHNQFASPQKLVLGYPGGLDLSSYIVKVPNEFLPYKRLLQEFGLRTSLSDNEVIAILYSIQKSLEERQQPFASPAEVKVSTEILCWLWRQKKVVPEDIPVLVVVENNQFTLKPRSEALICDLSKDKQNKDEFQFIMEEMYIVHEEIPTAAAEWLKIKFLSNHILAPESLGIEQCGQREPITTRIKNILKEYDEPNDIFKELIQNAEDAGADTCKFMIDFREHKDPPESLIDPGMSLCQGPCLWAFNNKQFTIEDWENVVKVGSASKETKMEKIGKFGLGFNTVYHLTDVPSILSGSRLLILDPNVTHLKKHIQHKTNPGIRLDLSQKRILSCFPGQFAQYEHIFDCNFSRQSPPEPYTGTLIKLPFRSEEEALSSEISTKVYDKHDILALKDYFRQNSKSYLLFLKNINTLSLQSISCTLSTPPKDDEMETILTVSKTVESLIDIEETSNSKQYQAVNSLQKIYAKCKDIIDSCTTSILKMTSHEQFNEPEEDFWLLYNCFGTGPSLEKALQENNNFVFSLPIGGVAVPLQTNPDTGKLAPLNADFVGQAFCFLPLPIHTGLPINVNGAFAVMSNRKSLWQSGEKRSWNEVLLCDPVTTAYITALLALKEMSEKQQLESYCYHSFWPNREKVSDSFKPLVDEFYSSIAAHQATDLELFSDGKRWCSMNDAIFLHGSIEEDKDIGALAVQICKEHVKKPKCVVSLPVWLRNSFKQCGLQNVLNSKILTWTRFYQEVVFENLDVIDPKSRDALVLHALDLNNKDINTLLVHHLCIPTTNGQLQCVKKLVSPFGKVAWLYEPKEGRLLGGTKNDFHSPKRIQRLLELGMTNDNLPLEEIALKAESITDTWKVNRKKAYENLNCLLEIMKKHIDDKDSCHWETLMTTAFLPAFSPGDIKMEGKAKLYKPTEVFTKECSMLVNMIHPVLDSTGLRINNADLVLERLGLQRNPDSDIVLHQLQKASNRKGLIDTTILHKIACTCYKFLDHWISECDDIALFSLEANSFPFIFIDDTFVNINQVAENQNFEAKPYLYVLPRTFKSFSNLWESVGVAKKFTTSHFQTVLHKIRSKYGSKSLSKDDLSICLLILKEGETDEKSRDDCLIPNANGALQPASELFFNDSPWIPVSPGVTLCHKDIPRDMALHFGIKTIRHHTLEHFTDDNFSAFSFDFEQREELAVRIKNIIVSYPSQKDILKELIQNADDAEATEIHFVWDKRQHGKEKTFGERWNHLQGPALCVFNNRVFSDEDLKGIQQLGEGGKRTILGKTGKFGIGFNSVYFLTDCPSILTGDKFLCISDPNMKYIETRSNNQKLGIGYKLDDTFKEMYDDVYRSFLPEQFLLEEGTMFRLPLRTEYNAKNSEISKQKVTQNDMQELCSALSDDPEGLILFLKNICKIAIHEINNQSGKLQTIFAVEKSLAQENRAEKDAFVKCLKDAFESQRPVTPRTVLYETTVSTSNKRQSKWVIAEQFGSFKSRENLFDKPPQGAIAAQVSTKGATFKGGAFCSLPLPGNRTKGATFKGGAFCSLPLPGNTGLPVHVNGNFEVDSSRKHLWKEDGPSQKSDWNEFLSRDVIAPLYAEMLQYIKQRIEEKTVSLTSLDTYFDASYFQFWPVVSTDVGPEWHEMIHEVYRSIKENGFDLIPVLRSSTQKVVNRYTKEYTFDWCNLRETEITEEPYLTHSSDSKINPILEDLGMKLVPSTSYIDKIWKSFSSAGIEVKHVSPAAVRTFLQAKPLNDPTKTEKDLPLLLTDTLIRDKQRCSHLLSFCLKDPDLEKVKHNPNLLNGVPLLLTTDGVLRVFDSASPKLISLHENLFSDYKDNFADYETNKSHRNILKASNLVKSLTLPCAAKYLNSLIQQHLQKCDVDLDNGLHVPNEAMVKWLESLWRFLFSEVKPKKSPSDKKAQTLKDVLKFFSDCCILPVVSPRLKNKHLLQGITNIASVIKFTSDSKITSILFKLDFLKLDVTFFQKLNHELLRLLCDELMDVNKHSSVLDQVCNIKHSEFSHLSNEDMMTFQKFLQTGLSMSTNGKECQWKLRSLPLFETVQGERVRIDGPQAIFVLNSTHLGKFPNLITLPKDTIFLKSNPQNDDLSQMLNITVLKDMEYFMKFILPHAHRLTENEILQLLKLLLLNYSQFSEYQGEIIPTMRTIKLIRSFQGQMQTASYYFNDKIELYKKLVSKDRFVPEMFWTELEDGLLEDGLFPTYARTLIQEFGMKHQISKEDIINFAHQLESEAKQSQDLKELGKKSLLLLREALNKVKDAKTLGEKLLHSIAHIPFLVPMKVQEELCSYHQAFDAERYVVEIRDSLINVDPKHQDLIWTSMPIIDLPVEISPPLLQMMKNVGAHEKPPSHLVTTNMRNICQSPCLSEQQIKTRAGVFRSAYAFLQAIDFPAETLIDLPVVLVEEDTQLVKASDVCLSLNNDLEFRPYLHKILPHDVLFGEFFRKIGVKEAPTAGHFCNVLAAVYADSRDKQQLNANQLKTVKRAVEQLFNLLKAQGNTILSDVEILYLPAVDGKLHSSSSLFYNDTTFETKRLEEALENKFLLLEKLSKCHLGCDIHDQHRLVQLLPSSLQPKMLTQLTQEEVIESHLQPCKLLTDCEFSGWFNQHLSSKEFRHGLVCLLKDQSQGKVSQTEASEMCDRTFGSIQIVCCESLATLLRMDKEPLEKTARETDVFVKRKQHGCIVYLKHNENMALKVLNAINMALTKEMNLLLGHRLTSEHLQVLGQLLLCDDLQDVQKTLADSNIHDSAETESVLFNPPESGTEIPEEWHDSLDMSFLNNFEEGEYVGYRFNDKYIYAVIAEEIPGDAVRCFQRYKVDIGQNELVEVSHLDLYQFKREKTTHCNWSNMELEPLAGAPPQAPPCSSPRSSKKSSSPLPASLLEAKREIDKCLTEIWSLPLEERQKGIRRLYLSWHPDKNPDCLELATEAFKYLLKRIDELTKGKVGTAKQSSSRGNWDFRHEQWNQEARHHRSSRERSFRGHNSYNFWTHYTNVPRPNKEEAQRWFRQARCDLDAAQKDSDGGSTEWCLFKIHQAVEKALTAAEFKRRGQRTANSTISATAEKVSHYHSLLRDLPKIVEDLKKLGVDNKRTQYPSCHAFPHIPNGQFKSEDGLHALNKASELFSKIQTYIQ